MPGGRPREYDRETILAAFKRYVDETEIPIVAVFCAQQGFGKNILYGWEEAKELLALCTTKKEAALEKKALAGEVNVTMAIFSLKQLGWKDRHELSGDPSGPIPLKLEGSDVYG